MIKNLLFILFLTLFMAACGGSGAGYESSEGDFGSVIELKSSKADTLDFGAINSGESLEYNLGLKNNDTVPIVLLNIETSCGCTTTSYDKKPIMPGDTSLLVLRYDTRNQGKGVHFKRISVVNSASEQPLSIFFHVDVK